MGPTHNSSDFLSTRARAIAPSPTLAVDAKAKELLAEGRDVCGFGAGEPDFDTPDFIKEACAAALAAGKTKYAPTAGLPRLRAALAERYGRERGFFVEPSQVVISPGGKFSCLLAILATCDPGDEVVIPAPYWVSYPEMVKLAGATPRVVPTSRESGFKISAEGLREVLNERTRMFILNSPGNPTGAVYTREEIGLLVETCLQHGVLLLSDEIYEYLLYEGAEHVSPASLSAEAAAQTITVSGFSKTYSMTGWRLGTLVAPPVLAKAITDLQSQSTSNATTFAQWGALAALEQPERASAAVSAMLEVFDRRRLRVWEALNAIEGIECPRANGAFYLFADLAGLGIAADRFASRLLEEELVAVVPGEGFGYPDGFRVSYATSDEVIDKGLERITRFCAGLRGAAR